MLRIATGFCLIAAFANCRVAWADELPVAKPEAVGMSSEKLALVVPAMQKLIDGKKIAGAITVVARKGKIVLFEAAGRQSISDAKPMKQDTIVRIYSMTKPISSVAIMMLVEEGKLGLDDPVAKHLPELKDLKVFSRTDGDRLQVVDAERATTIRDLSSGRSSATIASASSSPLAESGMSAVALSGGPGAACRSRCSVFTKPISRLRPSSRIPPAA